jgi:hypothetical protein
MKIPVGCCLGLVGFYSLASITLGKEESTPSPAPKCPASPSYEQLEQTRSERVGCDQRAERAAWAATARIERQGVRRWL